MGLVCCDHALSLAKVIEAESHPCVLSPGVYTSSIVDQKNLHRTFACVASYCGCDGLCDDAGEAGKWRLHKCSI